MEVQVVVILLYIWHVVKLMNKESHPTTGPFVSVQSVSPLNGFICAVRSQSFSFLTVAVVCAWVTLSAMLDPGGKGEDRAGFPKCLKGHEG